MRLSITLLCFSFLLFFSLWLSLSEQASVRETEAWTKYVKTYLCWLQMVKYIILSIAILGEGLCFVDVLMGWKRRSDKMGCYPERNYTSWLHTVRKIRCEKVQVDFDHQNFNVSSSNVAASCNHFKTFTA